MDEYSLYIPDTEKELPGEVLAIDENGEEIKQGDLVFIGDTTGFEIEEMHVITTTKKASDSSRIKKISEQDLQQEIEQLSLELYPKETWIDLDMLHSLGKNWQDRMFNFRNFLITEAQQGRIDGTATITELIPDDAIKIEMQDDEPIYIIGYAERVEENNTAYFIELTDDYGTQTTLVIQKELIDRPYIPGPTATYVEQEEKKYGAFFKANNIPKKSAEIIFNRVESNEQILERIKMDFPWFEMDDFNFQLPISDVIETSPVVKENYRNMSAVDKKRFEKLYALPRQISQVHGVINQEANEFELKYIRARNYANLCRLAVATEVVIENAIRNPGRDFAGNFEEWTTERLLAMTPKEKQEAAFKFIAEIEEQTVGLLKLRWEKEKRLFGTVIDNPYHQYVIRFANGDTINSQQSEGRYLGGAMAILTRVDSLTLRSDEQTSDEHLRKFILRRIAEVTAHEIGHDGYSSIYNTETSQYLQKVHIPGEPIKVIPWKYEEVWNQYKSVELPRYIAGETPAFDVVYNYKVTENADKTMSADNWGGTKSLVSMIERLVLQARSEKTTYEIYGKKYLLTVDLVIQSALATALKRSDEGLLQIENTEISVPGFKTLYDAYVQDLNKTAKKPRDIRNTYDQNLEGCTDTDYANYLEQFNAKVPEAEEVETPNERAHKLISEKIQQLANTNLH